ncbi:MAG: PilT/PilU family type 4a pilus ATPase [Candidatus Pacebacteria bacterium]|nr:PilT/PilU family type 4a pilus ATPase [Candidatus Paceibacterota bacterium]
MEHKKYIEDIITNLINQDGSDLHLGALRKPTIRVNGQLIQMVNQKALTQDDMIGILKVILGTEKMEEFLEKKEADFSYTFKEDYHLRCNAFFQQGLIGLALRLIPKIKSFEELNLPTVLQGFTRKKQGFFLVVGPIGQGKSTTLSTMIDTINKERSCHIVTIEDPVEFVYKEDKAIINQREVGIDTQDFSIALKSVFREDVNVILIGEMRNLETIASAVTAAETGHLVLSTLHTNNAAQTIDRIIDSFPPGQQEQVRLQLASSLLGVFSQRLVPRISGGRIPAYELLINNNAVANLIREKRTHEINTVIETSSGEGMIDMNRSLVDLVSRGEISIENAYQYSINPKGLERML